MKLLLCKNIEKLGIVGDVVEVAPGYARNYLLPQGLATEPTDAAKRALAEARRIAEEDRTKKRVELEELAKRLEDVEVTIRARANEEGALYGSVGTKEICDALADEEYYISAGQVNLERPIRHLDTVPVEIQLADDLTSTIKVWVVREKPVEGEEEDSEFTDEAPAGREAGANDDYTDG